MSEATPRSRQLKIRICDENREIIYLEFPSRSVDLIGMLIPAPTKAKIEAMGFCFEDAVARVRESGYAPQTLFDSVIDRRTYRVWLE